MSALSKLYSKIQRHIETEGTTEEALELQEKLRDRYAKYLEGHEEALVQLPEREVSLNLSHMEVDKRHLDVHDLLQAYIDDGNKSERSVHMRSLFSSKASVAGTTKTASKKHSSRRSSRPSTVSLAKSDRLSEARVQAELAKANIEQQRALKEAQQRKLAAEREAARQQIEFERQAAEERKEMEREAARRQFELDEQKRLREEELKQKDIQRRLLAEETERKRTELEEEIEMQRQLKAYENLRAEVRIREREELRSALGSDYDSEEDRDELHDQLTVTRTAPGPCQPQATKRFQDIEDQRAQMNQVLQEFSKPKARVDVQQMSERDVVENWLEKSDVTRRDAPVVPRNTPAVPRTEYRPPVDAWEPQKVFDTGRQRDVTFDTTHVAAPTRESSDIAVFSRVLQENRLPKPKLMTFDGDPKRYKLFMASFRNNVEARLDGDDQLKLTLLLDQCTGEAFELIEECVMLKPDQGYRTAIEKLEKRFGKNHLIARSYIDGVKKGGTIKPNDVKGLVKLADEMRKCQNVLTELRFASDLDSTGTIESIIDRLPEAMQNQWVKRSSKILNMGREPTFKDLTTFVEERADDFNSKYGQYVAEKRCAASKPRQQEHVNKSREKKRNVTTLVTSVDGAAERTAGLETASTCASTSTTTDTKKICVYCDKNGHYINTCFRFKKLELTEKRDVVKKNNLCFRCLRVGHGSADCDKVCTICSKKHHFHLHEEKGDSKPAEDKKTAAAGVVASTFKDRGRASLGVLCVHVRSHDKEVKCWALVDSGSNTTFIRRSVADGLGLKGPEHIFSVNTLGGTASHDEMCVDFLLTSEDGSKSVHVEGAFTIPSLQIRARYDGTTHTKWEHLADLEFPAVDEEIDILIGTDCTDMFWTENERRAGRKEPYARETLLGWILLGPTDERRALSANAASAEPMQAVYDRMLMADFEDVKCKEPVMSVDDKLALKTMRDTVHMDGGKFFVGIPWKVDPEEALQNNRSMAESRLRMLKKKFESNEKLAQDYTKTVEAYIADKQAMLVDEADLDTAHQWFLPHHSVFKRSNPEKCRVVFDCAAQYKGVSLNDVILQGPNFLNNLSGVLIRFRKEPVAVVGDIKLMFHQCFVLEGDRRF